MDFQLNEEQSMLKDSVRRFMEDNCSFEKRGPVIDNGSLESRNWQQFAELGLLGLTIPEEFGGMNCSAVEAALVMEEIGRTLCVEPYWAVAVLAAQTLIATGDPKASAILQTLCLGELLAVLAHDEVAAHAVLSDLGEDELKVTIILKSGITLDPEALCAWSADQMPYYAVPRYIEFRSALPKSPLGRVYKYQLRDEGVTPTTWDREKAGFKLAKR